jgi:hypothetical protein
MPSVLNQYLGSLSSVGNDGEWVSKGKGNEVDKNIECSGVIKGSGGAKVRARAGLYRQREAPP